MQHPIRSAFITLAALACGSATAVRADESAVRKVLSDQVAAWNKGDLDGFMAGYWNSPELTFQSGKDVTKGWKETAERYRKRYKDEGKEMGILTFSNVTVKMTSAETAYVTGGWELKLSKENPKGLYTLIFRKTSDGWKIVHDHTS